MNYKNTLKAFVSAVMFSLVTFGVAYSVELSSVTNSVYELQEDGKPICSGTFVTPTTFLTAGHCIDEGKHEFYIQTVKDGNVVKYVLNPLHVNHSTDTATLKLADSWAFFPYTSVAPKGTQLETGQEVYVVGYPAVLDVLYITSGYYSGTIDTPEGLDGKRSIVISPQVAPGSSGSGIFTEIDGQVYLIGTIEGGHLQYYWMAFGSLLDGVNAVL